MLSSSDFVGTWHALTPERVAREHDQHPTVLVDETGPQAEIANKTGGSAWESTVAKSPSGAIAGHDSSTRGDGHHAGPRSERTSLDRGHRCSLYRRKGSLLDHRGDRPTHDLDIRRVIRVGIGFLQVGSACGVGLRRATLEHRPCASGALSTLDRRAPPAQLRLPSHHRRALAISF